MENKETSMTMSEHVIKLKNRHQARLLDSLNAINTPSIVIDSIKKEMYFLADDIVKQVLEPAKQGAQDDCQEDCNQKNKPNLLPM